ncbi:NADH dehydrogenase [ubiquinone] 1 alpha subcomplex subunit 6 [Papilio machaon]|uniref:NADH dehydrogenase [ubiquinone] 1 alpha subcomplex subunit 6 n=1 Tax=Papilio machaon TaxID=76193 RepID=UPI0006EB0A3D|nr:NADH dehydrogenase [ubiquinone] 1 alpha subcomplex subunit 6 [Papilio machaon]
MSKEAAKTCLKVGRPVMSTNMAQAHTRVIGLYRAFYRYIPYILKYFDIPKNQEDCRKKLREYFYRNKFVTDVRVVDILVIKGYMELKEVTHQWQQKGYMMSHWNPSAERAPVTFVEKFLAGVD